MKPLVSILIPAYNAEQCIAETIRSALAQSWPNTEVIVMDDGSRDRTLAVARRFASKQVTVVTQSNQGAAATRNSLFSLSKGDYIQWLDADDLLSSNKVASQMESLANGSATDRTLLSSAWGYFLHRHEKAEFHPSALWHDLSPIEWMLRKMEQNLHMQTATWLVSRRLTDAAGPWNTRLLGDDDGEYFARVIVASDAIRFFPEARVYYRRSGQGSLSHIGRSDKKMDAQFFSMRLNIQYVRSLEDSPRARAACVTYLQNWLFNFYPTRLEIVRQAEELARALGGGLAVPKLPWKYAWIQRIFGWNYAKRAQLLLPRLKWSVIQFWDKILHRLQSQKPADTLFVL